MYPADPPRIFYPLRIQLHHIIDHDHQTTGVDQAVIHMDKEAFVTFRQLHQPDLTHRHIVPLKGFICPSLHDFICFFHRQIRQIKRLQLPVVSFHDILLYFAVFIRSGKTYSHTPISADFFTKAFFQQCHVQFCL